MRYKGDDVRVIDDTIELSAAAGCVKINKRKSIVHQKDFYALLVQEDKDRKEYLYRITADLEPFEEKGERDIPLNSKNSKPSAADRLQHLKDHAQVQLLSEDTITKEVDAPGVYFEKSLDGMEGQLFWTVPMDLKAGKYHIEIGSQALGICAQTEPFNITEAFGIEDPSSIGYICF